MNVIFSASSLFLQEALIHYFVSSAFKIMDSACTSVIVKSVCYLLPSHNHPSLDQQLMTNPSHAQRLHTQLSSFSTLT